MKTKWSLHLCTAKLTSKYDYLDSSLYVNYSKVHYIIIFVLLVIFPIIKWLNTPQHNPNMNFIKYVIFIFAIYLIFIVFTNFILSLFTADIQLKDRKIVISRLLRKVEIYYNDIIECNLLSDTYWGKEIQGIVLHISSNSYLITIPKKINRDEVIKFFKSKNILCK
jgi:hypothetical protein